MCSMLTARASFSSVEVGPTGLCFTWFGLFKIVLEYEMLILALSY